MKIIHTLLLLFLLLSANARLLSILDPIFGGLWTVQQLFGTNITKNNLQVDQSESDLGQPIGQAPLINNSSNIQTDSLMYFNSPLKSMTLPMPNNTLSQNGATLYQAQVLRKKLKRENSKSNKKNETNTSLINGTTTNLTSNDTINYTNINQTLNSTTENNSQNVSEPISKQPGNISINETFNMSLSTNLSLTTIAPTPVDNITQTLKNETSVNIKQQQQLLLSRSQTNRILKPQMQIYNESTQLIFNTEPLKALDPSEILGKKQEIHVEVQKMKQIQLKLQENNDRKQN